MLTPIEILQKIIESGGDCERTMPEQCCKTCPLGNSVRADGRHLNCLDHIGVDLTHTSMQEIRALYVRAAEEMLFALELQDILG